MCDEILVKLLPLSNVIVERWKKEQMVGQPHRPPTTYKNQTILQEEFKAFLVNRAESSAGKSKSCMQKYQGSIPTYPRK